MTNTDFAILLESLGLTRKELAQALEVHLTTIWRWEHGKVVIPRHVERELSRLVQEKA